MSPHIRAVATLTLAAGPFPPPTAADEAAQPGAGATAEPGNEAGRRRQPHRQPHWQLRRGWRIGALMRAWCGRVAAEQKGARERA